MITVFFGQQNIHLIQINRREKNHQTITTVKDSFSQLKSLYIYQCSVINVDCWKRFQMHILVTWKLCLIVDLWRSCQSSVNQINGMILISSMFYLIAAVINPAEWIYLWHCQRKFRSRHKCKLDMDYFCPSVVIEEQKHLIRVEAAEGSMHTLWL